jgi:hypothetical protein
MQKRRKARKQKNMYNIIRVITTSIYFLSLTTTVVVAITLYSIYSSAIHNNTLFFGSNTVEGIVLL